MQDKAASNEGLQWEGAKGMGREQEETGREGGREGGSRGEEGRRQGRPATTSRVKCAGRDRQKRREGAGEAGYYVAFTVLVCLWSLAYAADLTK